MPADRPMPGPTAAGDPPELRWVEDAAGLADVMARLDDEPQVAIDTESNSMYAYFERVCLVQISVPGLDVLVDALAVDLEPLGSLFADPRRQKVLHGADYDVLSLKRAYGFGFDNLYDTMLAARVLGWERYGLASILETHFDVRLNKKFQRYDWGVRPIDPEALDYARLDTRYLLALRELQWAELVARDRTEDCVHVCQRQARVEPRERAFDPDDFWKIKGVKELGRRSQAVLRSLFVFRDDLARSSDKPPFRIMNDGVLVYLAQRKPTDAEALSKIKGLSRPMVRRHGDALLAAIAAGMESDVEGLQRPIRPRLPKDIAARLDRLRAWRKDVAAERGVEPDVVIGKDSLFAVASACPTTMEQLAAVEEVDDWERERYGEALLAVVART